MATDAEFAAIARHVAMSSRQSAHFQKFTILKLALRILSELESPADEQHDSGVDGSIAQQGRDRLSAPSRREQHLADNQAQQQLAETPAADGSQIDGSSVTKSAQGSANAPPASGAPATVPGDALTYLNSQLMELINPGATHRTTEGGEDDMDDHVMPTTTAAAGGGATSSASSAFLLSGAAALRHRPPILQRSTDRALTVLCALCKVFVADVIAGSMETMAEELQGEEASGGVALRPQLQPRHVCEALRKRYAGQ